MTKGKLEIALREKVEKELGKLSWKKAKEIKIINLQEIWGIITPGLTPSYGGANRHKFVVYAKDILSAEQETRYRESLEEARKSKNHIAASKIKSVLDKDENSFYPLDYYLGEEGNFFMREDIRLTAPGLYNPSRNLESLYMFGKYFAILSKKQIQKIWSQEVK